MIRVLELLPIPVACRVVAVWAALRHLAVWLPACPTCGARPARDAMAGHIHLAHRMGLQRLLYGPRP